MSTIKLSAIKSRTAATPPIMQSQNGIDRGKFCRAWVSFGRKLGDVDQYEVMSQFNVVAIEDTAAGQFTIQFKVAMPSNRYACAGSASNTTDVVGVIINAGNGETPPLTTARAFIRTTIGPNSGGSASPTDSDPLMVTFFAYGDE